MNKVDNKLIVKCQQTEKISIEEVNRLLEVGHLLFSVLTSKEVEDLQKLLYPKKVIGNTGAS